MAKIKFGMMMTDARGKLGGQVFSKNRAGAYVRTKVTPVNPRTAKQMASRSILGTLSQGWNALTLAQVTAWNKAVSQWARTDIFGDLKNPTGKNLYVSLNKNLLGAGLSMVTLPPEKIEMVNISGLAVKIDTVAEIVEFQNLSAIADGVFQVMASPIVPTGVNYVKNRLRVITHGASGSEINSNFSANYEAVFGYAPLPDRMFVQVRQIGENGQAGTPIMVRTISA